METDMYMEKTAHYHNTNLLEGKELVDADDKALHMEERIHRFLKKYAGREYTPWEIHDYFPEYLIGSIRRALTNLASDPDRNVFDTIGEKRKKKERKGTSNFMWYYKPFTVNEQGQVKMF